MPSALGGVGLCAPIFFALPEARPARVKKGFPLQSLTEGAFPELQASAKSKYVTWQT